MRLCVLIRAVVCVAIVLPGAASAKIKVIEQRIDAAPGGVLVVPIEVGRRFDLRQRPVIRAGDGRTIPGKVWWVTSAGGAIPTTGPGWLPEPRVWSGIGGLKAWRGRDASDPTGRWVLLGDLPADIGGLELTYRGQKLPINWLDGYGPGESAGEPEERVPELETDLEPVLPVETGLAIDDDQTSTGRWLPEISGVDVEVIDRLQADPMTRWRGHLLGGTLERPAAIATPIDSVDGLIERLARAQTLRWLGALERVRRIDEPLALELVDRLGLVIASDERTLPAWASAASLPGDLLDPGATNAQVVRRARGWLVSQGEALVWVIDDAGGRTGSGSVATLGVAPLAEGEGGVLVRTESVGARQAVSTEIEPVTVEARVVTALPLKIGNGSEGAGLVLRSARVPVRVGAWRGRFEVVTSALAARPPGVRLGPLMNRWTMASWLGQRGGADAAPPPERTTAALLQRTQHPGDDRTGHGWELIVECAFVEGSPTVGDTLTIWLGAFGSPSAVIDLRPDGIAMRRGAGDGAGEIEASGVIEGGRWIGRVRLPSDAIGGDGVLLVGLSRTDATGWATSWPRRMMPGQAEPGRLAFDLSAWDGLGRE